MCYSTSWARQIILMSERQLISCIIQWVSSHLAVQPSYPYYHQNKMKENLSQSFFHIVVWPAFSLVFCYWDKCPCTVCFVQFWQLCRPWIQVLAKKSVAHLLKMMTRNQRSQCLSWKQRSKNCSATF